MPTSYTDVVFSNLGQGGITATKLNKLRDDLSSAIAAGGGGGTGDMTKAVYDTNNNGKVDTCDSVPWGSVTGAPGTFAPSPHQTSHVSGTDQIPSAGTSARGLMPQANGNPNAFYGSDGTQKQVAYTMLSGSQPGPVAHAASHLDNGSDPIPVASTTRTGLAPVRSGSATTYLNGAGAYTTPSGSGDMLKSVYDTNADNIVDQAAAVPWTGITGKPATFPPSTHASTHVTGGGDVIAAFTSTVNGLVPASGGVAGTFLRSDGTFAAPAGGGDMLKSVYDVNNDGIVDRAAITFFTKTAAYTLTTADSGKYVICSGGSWTLTLPAPVVGLNYRLRNDMGISGTTGTITLSPTGGTIDGLASIPLLPQQECTLITDGTNWRTHELKREVILGTQDITSAQASGTILLPVGYRFFNLDFSQIQPAVDNSAFQCQVSVDGGATWLTSHYSYQIIYNNSATTAAAVTVGSTTAQAFAYLALNMSNLSTEGCLVKTTFSPGTAVRPFSFLSDSGYFAPSLFSQSRAWGSYDAATPGIVNALKYFFSSGNIAYSLLTVKGVV